MIVKKLSAGILLLLLLLATLLAFFLKPENMAYPQLLAVLAWTYVLTIGNWFSIIYFLPKQTESNNSSTIWAVLPSIAGITLLYSIASLTILFWFLAISNFGELSNAHWNLQFINFGLFGTIFLLILIASKTAQIPNSKTGTTDKTELLNIIKETIDVTPHSSHADSIRYELMQLSEAIKFFVPHISSIKNIELYEEISTGIAMLKSSPLDNDLQLDEIKKLVAKARRCK